MTKIRAALFALAALTAVFLSTAALSEDAFDRALWLASEERYRESRQALDPLLEREPDNARGRVLHGILRVHEGNRDEAIGIFHEVVREFPDMFEAYNNLAVLYVDQGRLEDARGLLLAILERRPEVVGYENLGDIYARLARRAHARGRELASGRAVQEGSGESGALFHDAERSTASTAGSAADAQAQLSGAPSAEVPRSPSDVASSHDFACVLAGTFRTSRALEDAQQWLRSRGAEIVGVSREARESIKDYRVYLPPFESRRSATKRMRELRDRGVRDVAVILSGPLTNAVSLGIYASKANLGQRVARLGRLGYSVMTAANTTTIDEHLTIRARVGRAPGALSDAWASRFPSHSLRLVNCS